MRTLYLAAMVVLLGFVASAGAFASATANPLTTDRVDAEETSFGDLATDALCAAASTTVALAPAVSFKPGAIPAGPVTKDAVSGLLYDAEEKWAVLELTGAQIRAALERAISFAPTPRLFFLQVSGLTVVYNRTAARGRRIKSLAVGFAEINDTAKYEVAMPGSLADGGSGYFTIFAGANKIRTGTEGLAQVITQYVDRQGTVSYTGQGRIVVGG